MTSLSEHALAHAEAGFAPTLGGRDVVAPLTFIVPGDDKPVFHSQAYTGGESKFFFDTEQRAVTVTDMRPHASDFTLDREGFAFRTIPTATTAFSDEEVVRRDYYAEVSDILTEELGASRVEIFDATRRSDSGAGAANTDGRRGIASRIHVDYTATSGPQRARDVFGDAEFDRLIANGARIVQVNVWRPLRGPVKRSPLALADASTIAEPDLVATDQVFPDRTGEIYHLTHHPAQRWYYAPDMTRDEVLLIKGWDSLDDGRARFTPHTAFPLPTQNDATPPRESIEVRAYAVIE